MDVKQNISITDAIQSNFDLENYTLIRDVIIVAWGYLAYTQMPTDVFVKLVKYYITFVLIRWIISSMTTIEINKKGQKKYFQISGHVGLFTLITLFLMQVSFFGSDAHLLPYVFISTYALFNVAVKAHFTSDVINTVLFIHFMVSLPLLRRIF
jgi:hypothetical protein